MAYVIDQHGNTVPGQSINYVPSNGTMDSNTEGLFIPYASGAQTVQVSWTALDSSTQMTTVAITVETGAPSYFVLDGCQGTVPAGIWCAVTHTLYDQFGNEISDVSEAGDLTWTTSNGNYSETSSEYFPDHVGMWHLNLTSSSGAAGSLMVTVGHGQIASLELDASTYSITADDHVWINTTRIDIRGNRLPVLLPQENWVQTQDGQLTVGAPAKWTPQSRGAKILEATYETVSTQITIAVQEGAIVSLILIVENNESTWNSFDITADDILDVKVKAYDQKDNRWIISADWSVTHAVWTDQSVLEQFVGDETTFVPYLSSTAPYSITATYNDGFTTHIVSINVTVSQGDLASVVVTASGSDGATNSVFDMTADEYIDFSSALADLDTNPIDSSILTWTLTNLDSGDTEDITDLLANKNMRWEASEVGNWSISASAFSIQDTVTMTVHHGQAVTVLAVLDTSEQTAGGIINMVVTGTDSDGNTFPQLVEWTEDGVEVENITAGSDEGTYAFKATIAGPHTLDYSTGIVSNSANISVDALYIVHSLTIELSSESIDQLGSFTVTVKAFDEYLNPISIPSSADVDATGRAEVLNQGQGVWNIVTLDDGPQTVTITAGSVTEERNVEVVGNVGGFFKAGGPLYYVGAVLIGIVSLVIVGLLVSMLRGGDADYDEYDDEYEEDDEPSGPAPGPTGPAPVAKSIPDIQSQPDDTSWQVDHRVDDDGTEWAEDENGTWWYRQDGDTEWGEWTD